MNAEGRAEARQAYDAFAPSFDEFNRRYRYERWTGRLLECADAAGLGGWRLLDVGCGTGLSFITLLGRGFEVTGCDISPKMLQRAETRGGGAVRLEVADMRALPQFGEFDLVWSLNDAVNYLMDETELASALHGMRRNLAPAGIVLFDLNTLTQYRSLWSEELVVEGEEGRRLLWRGLAREIRPGGIYEASYEGVGEGVEPHRHRQRHFDEQSVLVALGLAGLEAVAVLGESLGELTPGVDEDFHTKAVYVCRAKGAASRRGPD